MTRMHTDSLPYAARLPDGSVVVSTIATPGTTLILTLSDARFLRTSLAQLIEADAAEQAGALCVSDFREA